MTACQRWMWTINLREKKKSEFSHHFHWNNPRMVWLSSCARMLFHLFLIIQRYFAWLIHTMFFLFSTPFLIFFLLFLVFFLGRSSEHWLSHAVSVEFLYIYRKIRSTEMAKSFSTNVVNFGIHVSRILFMQNLWCASSLSLERAPEVCFFNADTNTLRHTHIYTTCEKNGKKKCNLKFSWL